ncbi:MAG: phosphoglucomutase/phosphomannomutase family protein [Crocinitomicaceae bacterium]|nr:phosphoglucomutase/phosphomannomutase family protein [Crocinitomicaceae bacterium]
MSTIKFGTDGWRAIIAEDYTVDNVARVSVATAKWVKQNYENPKIVIGYDCRFAGKLFAETAAKIFVKEGIQVIFSSGFVSTPMVSLGVVKEKASLGVVITASHNPPSYNGFKLKGDFGGPLLPEHVAEVEAMIPNENNLNLEALSLDSELFQLMDLETLYVEHAQANFDLDLIQKSGLKLAYDAMFGAGQNAVRRLLPNATLLHCEQNPGFNGQAPEPIDKNLQEFSNLIKNSGDIDSGLATDGDADRIGLYNAKGEFIDSHHIILLLIHYLVKYKGMTGKVVTAFSCTPKIAKLCEHYGLEHQTVKIGFKYVAGIMISEDCLLGGEESGGIATAGHIPERDGIWMGLIIWEFMAKSGKSLDDLIQEVYDIVGPFAFERDDLHISEDLKQSIISNCKGDKYSAFGDYSVEHVETIDGFKYFFDEDRWYMIRPSGTEPVLRTYCQAPTLDEVRQILKIGKDTLTN